MYCPDCGLQNRDTAKFCTGCGVTLTEVAVGTVLGGRYRVAARLGQGGMGVVYRAFDVRLECACAIKEMNAAGQTPDERAESVARFKREAQTLRGLSHPGLPKVYDFFDDAGRHFLVQDFVEGESFEALLAREGKPGLPEAEVQALALAALDILVYLHAQSPPVIHRDVKPANLMRRTGTGQVVLVDFGIARSHANRTNTALGTPEYCAPEQYAGKAEPASDVYALGATLHHLVTGAVPTPFQFPSPAGVSAELRGVLAKATALNPLDRYASAEEMRKALKRGGGPGASGLSSASGAPMGGGVGMVAAPLPHLPQGPGPSSPAPSSSLALQSPAMPPAGAPALAPAPGPARAVPATSSSASPTVMASAGDSAARRNPAAQSTATAVSASGGSGRWVALACGVVLLLLVLPFVQSSRLRPSAEVSPRVEGASTTIVNPKDGMVLVCIPGGTYPIGSDAEDSDEKPAHTVTLKSYAIGKYEVTNAQYRKFVQATSHKSADDWESYARQWGEQAPVVNVSWSDAVAYCEWAELRLPTEAEWEAAARGPAGLRYPWGNAWDASKCCNSVDGRAWKPVAVGSYPAGASPFGCQDMAGNVWEWCSSRYMPYPYNVSDGREDLSGDGTRVLRGGSWLSDVPSRFRGADRDWSDPADGYVDGGFRSARTL